MARNGQLNGMLPGLPSGKGSVLSSDGAVGPVVNSPIQSPSQNMILTVARRPVRGGADGGRIVDQVSANNPLPIMLMQRPASLQGFKTLLATNTVVFHAVNGAIDDVWLWISNRTQYQLNLELNLQKHGIAANASTQLFTLYQLAPYANFQFPPAGCIGLAVNDIISAQASDPAAHTGCNVFVFGRPIG